MRLAICVVLFAALCAGQTTTVSQAVLTPDGKRAQGSAVISIASQCTSAGGSYIGSRNVRVDFINGDFSVALIPNDTCLPSAFYSVTWTLVGAKPWTEYWVVPTSGSALSISAVLAWKAPLVLPMIPPKQINAAGLTSGTYCLTVVNGVITGLSACTGGGGSLLLSTLTNGQLAALTNSQLLALGN